ncbi:hypothetical protein CEXT_716321 [Caerostris extrusa]|uniref:Uncharacterized protein n=1 Tax=Caerostris extrusa TaxID=172846 RepID=A0AAV4VY16_CAEEX|nr:hypothetical protein CEXT_716321 [Caerostris extrusa]
MIPTEQASNKNCRTTFRCCCSLNTTIPSLGVNVALMTWRRTSIFVRLNNKRESPRLLLRVIYMDIFLDLFSPLGLVLANPPPLSCTKSPPLSRDVRQ